MSGKAHKSGPGLMLCFFLKGQGHFLLGEGHIYEKIVHGLLSELMTSATVRILTKGFAKDVQNFICMMTQKSGRSCNRQFGHGLSF